MMTRTPDNAASPVYPHSLFSLEGRCAIITGIGPGMGRSIARAYAAAGAAVVMCARSEPRVRDIEREITAAGGTAIGIVADVSKDEDRVRLVETAREKFGRIDVLFNNAHINPAIAGSDEPAAPGAVSVPNTQKRLGRGCLDMDMRDWMRGVEVNVYAPYRLSQLVVPIMRKNRSGSIINMVTDAAEFPDHTAMMVYGATKAALATQTRYLAKELAPDIRVNALCPGVMTESGEIPATYQAWIDTFPFRRAGRADEIVGAALFLASDASSYMTAELLRSDGGRLRARRTA